MSKFLCGLGASDTQLTGEALRDGRAPGGLEAVLWHGGEAEATKQRVMLLPAAERAALIAFVQSL